MSVALIIRLLTSALIAVYLLALFRWIRRQSAGLAAIVACGFLVRAVVGLSLFWVSYLELPLLKSLQLGGGFWSLMLDARGYFETASGAVEQGIGTIADGSASPFFTRVLALWMSVVGVSPAAAMLLNLCSFVSVCTVLTWTYRPVNKWSADLPLAVSLAAISFSPVLVVHSTQALKDDLFLALVVLLCVAVMGLFRALAKTAQPTALLLSLLVLAVSIYGTAGIRPYYPAIVFAWFGGFILGFTIVARTGRRLRTAGIGGAALAVIWLAYWAGAGPYFRPSPAERQHIASMMPWNRGQHETTERLQVATSIVDNARRGFAQSGGDSNIVPTSDTPAPPPTPAGAFHLSEPVLSWATRLEAVALGLGTYFVPMTALKQMSLVTASGGRGLMPVADVDTVFMDLCLVLMLCLIYQRRHLIQDEMAFVIFVTGLAILTVLLLGYVVTNLGTLFRMRYLGTAPVWALALAVAPRTSRDV